MRRMHVQSDQRSKNSTRDAGFGIEVHSAMSGVFDRVVFWRREPLCEGRAFLPVLPRGSRNWERRRNKQGRSRNFPPYIWTRREPELRQSISLHELRASSFYRVSHFGRNRRRWGEDEGQVRYVLV